MGNLKKGFGAPKQKQRASSYWIACYSKEDEDVPLFTIRRVIDYVPGQDVVRMLLVRCRELLLETPDAWEVLVHQGPTDVPDSGEQIIARLSREPFDLCEEMPA